MADQNFGVEHNFIKHWAGDTVKARTFSMTRDTGGGPVVEDFTNVQIKMHVRDEFTDIIAVDLSVGSGISVTTTDFTVDEFAAPVPSANRQSMNFKYDIEFTYISGRVVTYIYGILPVELSTSR